MQSRSLIFYTRQEKQAIQQAAENYLRLWSKKWFIDPEYALHFNVTLQEPSTVSQTEKTQSICASDPEQYEWCIVLFDQGVITQLAELLFKRPMHRHAESDIVRSVVQSAIIDFCNKFSRASMNQQQSDFLEIQNKLKKAQTLGSGSLVLQLSNGNHSVSCLVSPSLLAQWKVRTLASETTPVKLTPMIKALQQQKIKSVARLGKIELDLASLSTLKVGDVIMLDKTVDQPVTLEFTGSSEKLTAYIGKVGEKVALRLNTQVRDDKASKSTSIYS